MSLSAPSLVTRRHAPYVTSIYVLTARVLVSTSCLFFRTYPGCTAACSASALCTAVRWHVATNKCDLMSSCAVDALADIDTNYEHAFIEHAEGVHSQVLDVAGWCGALSGASAAIKASTWPDCIDECRQDSGACVAVRWRTGSATHACELLSACEIGPDLEVAADAMTPCPQGGAIDKTACQKYSSTKNAAEAQFEIDSVEFPHGCSLLSGTTSPDHISWNLANSEDKDYNNEAGIANEHCSESTHACYASSSKRVCAKPGATRYSTCVITLCVCRDLLIVYLQSFSP